MNSTNQFTAKFTFSEAVTGFVTDDVMVTGGTKGTFSGSGTTYTLQVTPSGSANVVVTVAADAATDGNNAGPASAVSATAIWDGAPPTVVITDVPAKINSTAQFTAKFTFSEAVTGFVTDDIRVSGGTKGTFSGSGTTYTLLVTPSGSADAVVTVMADAATDGLNTGPASAVSATATWDMAALMVTIGGVPAKINSTAALNVTFTFSRAVTGFETGDVTVTGGKKGTFSGSGTTYTLVVTPTSGSNVTVTVATNAATDGVGTGPASAVSAMATWDAAALTVVITGVPAKINSTDVLNVTFTFSKDVTGFIIWDVTVTGARRGTFTETNQATYTLEVMPTSGSNVTVTVAADAATDGHNTGPASAVSTTAIWDATPPSFAISGVPHRINSTAPFTVTLLFSENVTGFETGDVTVTGGTKGAFIAHSGSKYTLVVTPIQGSSVNIAVRANVASDGVNTGPVGAHVAFAHWDVAPMVSITGVPAKINSTTAFTAIFTFSEDVTGFETGDISVAGGTKGMFSGSRATYMLVVTPSGSADVVVTVAAHAATDGFNTGPTSTVSATATWDTAAPAVAITGMPAKINSTSAFTAIFTFSEAVTGFEIDDVTVTGGTKGAFSATNATTYMLAVTPSGSADVVVFVAQNTATTTDGTAGPASPVTATAIWDAVAPKVRIGGVPPKINSTMAFTATFTFSEDVTGFATGDVMVTGGTKGAFAATNATTYTLAMTPTSGSNMMVTVAANAATDGINTGPASAVSAMSTWDAAPNTVLTSASSLTIVEGGSDTYSVWLSSQPSGTVTVRIRGIGATDLTLDRQRLTFNSSGSNLWSYPQTVTVTAGQDADWTTDSATLTNRARGGGYGGITTDVMVTTDDDDTTPSPPYAYLVQAVHSFFKTVPLVAGGSAWLRVFPTANAVNSTPLPKAVATFYVNNQVTHTVNLASKTGPIPTEVWPQAFQLSYDAQIPASIIKPGLEMVIEIDPDDEVPANLGVTKRIPPSGRLSLDVATVPNFEVTFIPLVTTGFTGNHDVEAIVQQLAANPGSHARLSDTRTLLPIKDISATAHATVTVSERGDFFLYNKVVALRAMAGGSGYWMGLHTDPDGAGGLAERPGVTSLATPSSYTIAHEFGHNLSLAHAPCPNPINAVDLDYPYADGSIGSWGIENNSILGPDETRDLMSYCAPYWISDYQFNKAVDHRTSAALSNIEEPPVAPRSTEHSLLLWGGMDADSRPYLEPVFVVEAAPMLPQAPGPWQLVGYAADGDEMFNLTIAMPEVAHGGGASAFAFIVPWQQDLPLNAVTLSGSGGSFTINGEHNDPMAIVIDESSGQVTGFLENYDPSGDSRVSAISNKFGGDTQRVLFSRGIPDLGVQN
ncbi:MAG: Ig-like domain-containing protein [Bacteroidota bacterium]|nr:Ig-like domain-containing protein [Bacteroidota bacterium]